MNATRLLAHFDRISEAPNAIPRLRQFIFDLAVRGELVRQDATERPASDLLKSIKDEKVRLMDERAIKRQSNLSMPQDNPLGRAIPAGWVLTTLGELSLKITDGTHKTPTYVERGVPFISVKDFSAGKLDFSYSRFISPDEHAMLSKRCDPRRGDILIGRIGTLGKAVLVDTDQQFSLFVSVGLIRFSHEFVNPAFFRLLLNSPLVEREFDRIKIGGATHTNKLNLGDLHGILLPLPPLSEQHRIVVKVNELMLLCDELEGAQAERECRRNRLLAASLIRLNHCAEVSIPTFRKHVAFHLQHLPLLSTRLNQIRLLRQTILNLAIRGRLVLQDPTDESTSELLKRIENEKFRGIDSAKVKAKRLLPIAENEAPFQLPDKWRWVRFGELISDADSGWSPRSESFPRTGSNWGVLKVSAVSWDKFQAKENKQLLIGVIPRAGAQVRAGDFLISRANTSELVAKCVVVEQEPRNLILSDKIVRLQISQGCNKRYLSIVNNHAQYARTYYAQEASGTSHSMKNVSRQVIYDLPIPLPPFCEQQRIVVRVEELMRICDRLEAEITCAQTGSRRLLEAVLHHALSGGT